jgi:excisionase family DNA binding protein
MRRPTAMSISAQKNPLEPRAIRSVSIDEAAGILGVSRRTVYNRIRDGRLRTLRTLGGSQRVLVESLSHGDGGPSTDRFDHPGALVARRPVS